MKTTTEQGKRRPLTARERQNLVKLKVARAKQERHTLKLARDEANLRRKIENAKLRAELAEARARTTRARRAGGGGLAYKIASGLARAPRGLTTTTPRKRRRK